MEVTLTYVSPGPTNVTRPFWSTVTTEGSRDAHVTDVSTPADAGRTVAVSWNFCNAICAVTLVLSRVMLVTPSVT